MTKSIDYGTLMHRAMRGLIHDVLDQVERSGLPGEHHFFITFDARQPGVELADWLRERYPEEMTVVVQHWYEDLEVDDAGFGITLNFGDSPERLYIPFGSIRTFVDPSVEFGLRFETSDSDEEEDDEDEEVEAADAEGGRPEAEVVSLDKWRK